MSTTNRRHSTARSLLWLLVGAMVLAATPVIAQKKGKAKGGDDKLQQAGDVMRFGKDRRAPAKGAKGGKGGKGGKDAAAKPDEEETKKAVPRSIAQRRARQKSNVEDIDDEIDILRELLDIERGSPTEADTLLELSYVLWDRAEAYELEAYDTKLTVGIQEAKDKGDKDTARRLEIEQQNLHGADGRHGS